MKRVLSIIIIFGTLSVSAFAIDGEILYQKCVACHGVKGEMIYLNKVDAINVLSKEQIVEMLKGYKEGKIDKFKMGKMMKAQTNKMSQENMENLGEYIETLK